MHGSSAKSNLGFSMEGEEDKNNEKVISLSYVKTDKDDGLADSTPSPPPRYESCEVEPGLAGAANHDAADQQKNSCDSQADYSIFSFIPKYEEYKAAYMKKAQQTHMGSKLRAAVVTLLVLLYAAYFIAVLAIHSTIEETASYWCGADGLLIILTFLVVFFVVYFQIVKRYFGKFLHRQLLVPLDNLYRRLWKFRVVRWSTYIGLVLIVAIFLIIDTAGERDRLVSLFGLFVLVALGFIFSYAPRKIVWRHVFWGIGLQFVFGLVILRWSVGRNLFQCAANKVAAFLTFTDKGSLFVFGNLVLPDRIFAFKVLSVILFFSFIVQILYYNGVMQWVVMKLGWLLQVSVGTTACESVNAAGNIFLGQSEAPLLIRPYVNIMTRSELHAVLTGGFATIAGGVMAAYINFGVSAPHLLSASVMSAPAALAYAKLFYPETEESKTGSDNIKVVKSGETNWLHAAMVGVLQAIPLVANITANLIAFIAFIAFVNSIFNWTCQLVDVKDGTCSLEGVVGYIFMPLAWCMGVSWDDCHSVGKLIGIKTIINEFVAYAELSQMIEAKKISARAQIIATYALCGFSNIGSIGIQLGAMGSLAPDRRSDLARVAFRAMIAGSAACFMTGCIVGTLLSDSTIANDLASSPVADVLNSTTLAPNMEA